MSLNNLDKQTKFIDYLYILYKWKKFLIINLLFIVTVSTIIAYLIPKTYKATATIMLAPKNNLGLSGLTNTLLSGNSAVSLGAKLFGMGKTNDDLLLGLLNSRAVISKVVYKFHLYKYYNIKNRNYDKLMKSLKSDLIFDRNEFGFITISVINEKPYVSAAMANYFVKLADSLNIYLDIEQAKRNKNFIEKRFLQSKKDLKAAEESFYHFQKKYGVFEVPEQVKAAIKTVGTLETKLIEKEILLKTTQDRYSKNSALYKTLYDQIQAIKSKLHELNFKSIDNLKNSILIPLNEVPELQMKYVRHFRELKIKNKILEFLYPLYEQAKIEERKSIPTILIIDKAVPPQLKYAPKKAFIILGITFLFFCLFVLFIFRGEAANNRREFRNILDEKETKFFKGFIKFYKMNF